MPTTSLGFRYPASTSAVDVPTDIGNLAADINTYATTVNTFITRKDGVQVASSISSSAAIGTTATAVLTLTNCLFQAGRAYSVENVGLVFGDAAGRLADFSVYKTRPTFSTEYARPAWKRQFVRVRTAVAVVPIAAELEMDEATCTPSLRVMNVFTVVAYVLMSAARFPMSVGTTTADVLAG